MKKLLDLITYALITALVVVCITAFTTATAQADTHRFPLPAAAINDAPEAKLVTDCQSAYTEAYWYAHMMQWIVPFKSKDGEDLIQMGTYDEQNNLITKANTHFLAIKSTAQKNANFCMDRKMMNAIVAYVHLGYSYGYYANGNSPNHMTLAIQELSRCNADFFATEIGANCDDDEARAIKTKDELEP